jgi:hypothetical protein
VRVELNPNERVVDRLEEGIDVATRSGPLQAPNRTLARCSRRRCSRWPARSCPVPLYKPDGYSGFNSPSTVGNNSDTVG